MSYFLNSIKDIENVFVPNLESINDNFLEFPTYFPKSNTAIKESLNFYENIYIGEEREKETLSLENFNSKNKNHIYKGVNYPRLIEKMDLNVFHSELEKKVENDQAYFIKSIESEAKTLSEINFKVHLTESNDTIYNSIKNLGALNEYNIISKIIIERYLNSYKYVHSVLENKYKNHIPTAFKNLSYLSLSNDMLKNKPISQFIYPQRRHSSEQINEINELIEADYDEDVFKEYNTFLNFKKYTKNHIIEPYKDYSYLFQRLKNDNLIHNKKHLEFVDWLFEKKFITEKVKEMFYSKNGFESLNNSKKDSRIHNYNLLFG